jgi:outer membrane biosynthesis protein TonB
MKKKKNTETAQYGAAEIKQAYFKNFRRGLEFAVVLHVVVLTGYLGISYFNDLNAADIKDKPKVIRKVDLSDISIPPSTNDNDKTIPKPDQEIVKPVKDLGALIPQPVAKDKADEMTIKTQKQLDEINTQVSREGDSVKYVADIGNNNITVMDDHVIKNSRDTRHDNPDVNYNSFEVEVVPECVNLGAVKNSMVYPQVAVESGIQGIVSIRVLVGTDGHVIQTGKITGPEVFYDEVREKAMNLEFTSGLQNGKAVKVWMTVPFSFTLKN